MSWSCNIQIPKGTPFREAEKMLFALKPAGGQDSIETLNALGAAQAAACGILASGTVSGGPNTDFDNRELAHGVSINLSGHANPNHQPAKNWANDQISVAVYQMTDPTSAEA